MKRCSPFFLLWCGCVAWLIACGSAPVLAADSTDVTKVVAAAVKDNKLSIQADNATFGDTAPGIPKKLRIEFRVGDEKREKEVNEDGLIEISAPSGKKLVVTKAIYGPADGSKPAAGSAALDPAVSLETLPGFTIETVLSADRGKHGSWICLAKDPKGRLLLGGQRGQPTTRVTLEGGKIVKEETLRIPVTEVMGMLFVENTLYVNGAGPDGKFGLYRCQDTKGDESYSAVELLREWRGGAGEHGAHGIVLGPDKKLYTVCGNFVDVPSDLAPTSPHRVYGDDLPLKRAEDGNGFGAGRKPPGGFVIRMDLDGKNAELYSSGERNTYDIGFNADGELFGFDSDMEWDWGAPWYRPIHVFHAVRGGDHGFREGSAKWPEYYADSLPRTATIGIGCPTGVVFGSGAKFPVKYQQAFYVCDWTYGRLIAVHLTPKGASYTGVCENFVAPKSLRSKGGKTPLNLTDVVIGDDGSMYFTIGGRGTQASLFRVTYTGAESAAAKSADELSDKTKVASRQLRRTLEGMNVQPDAATVESAWPHLNSPDRFIRYSARLAIERNPVAQWQEKALAEKQPQAALTALLALARLGSAETQPAIVKALSAIPFASLTEEQMLDKLRVYQVSISRQGAPTGDIAKQIIADVDPLYPAKSQAANNELSQILLALNAPQAVAKTVWLLRSAPTQEEQVTYAMNLRNVKSGWNTELRKAYLSWWNEGRATAHPADIVRWFEEAGIRYNNGASFANYMSHAREDAKRSLSPDELVALKDVLSRTNKPAITSSPIVPSGPPRKLVKTWTTADLQPQLDQVAKGRSFAKGKSIFREAQCISCHRYGDEGGAVGSDLTAVAARFKRQDILESITEPSKVVSEQYMNTAITTKEGRVVVGRIADESEDQIVIRPKPLETETVAIKKSEIESRKLSNISPMPEGLLNNFTQDEIFDLLAYLESLGDEKHPNFEK